MPAAPPKAPKRIAPDMDDDDSVAASNGSSPTDAQSTDQTTGFTGTLTPASGYPAPPPSTLNLGMGGDVTQPSDFAQEVNAATAVPSKGGPSPAELYVANKRGAIGKPSPPKEDQKAKSPESKEPPKAPDTGAYTAPPAIPGPSPGTTTTPATTTPATTTTDQQPAQEVPPSMQDPANAARIKKYAGQYLADNQNFADVPDEAKHDPSFAGIDDNGVPMFLDENNRTYYKTTTGPGAEVRHYMDSPPGSKEALDGVPITDETKAAMSRDATQRLMATIESKKAIDDYNTQARRFQAGVTPGENPFQQAELGVEASGGSDWKNIALKAGVGLAEHLPFLGITQDMRNLDAARARVANTYSQSMTKNIPTGQETRTTLETPNIGDSLEVQQSKINNINQTLEENARTLATMYPYQNPALKQQLNKLYPGIFKESGGITSQPANQNAPQSSTARSTATPASSPTPSPKPSPTPSPKPSPTPTNLDYDYDHSAWKKLKTGDQFTYKGQTHTK